MMDVQIQIAKSRNRLHTQQPIVTGQEVGKRVSFHQILARETEQMQLPVHLLQSPVHLPRICLRLNTLYFQLKFQTIIVTQGF